MVKKGQSKGGKPGGGGGAKKPSPATTTGDDSFIVFSNSDKDPKPKRPATASAGPSNLDGPDILGEAPKRPDVKKIIGGASWTGKLPVNMLSEHCQKQRWEKPEYTMSKTPEGYSSMVILKAKNPKTQELVQLAPFKLPPSHKHLAAKPTALEARHFAATYGLFRVCSMRNIHMMLPPDYRDLWKGEFEVLKKEDIKDGRGWQYEADPFQALREREEAKALMEKRRAEQNKAKEKALNTPGGPGGVGLALRNGGSGGVNSGSHNIQRGWTRVPKIEMGKRARTNVENLIRKYAIWNPNGVRMSDFQKHSIINEFKNLQFRESHVEEAVQECKDREETLEWLLIHVPEDDLPRWSLPEGYTAGISMGSSDLKREGAIKRLAEAGYSIDLAKQIFDRTGDESTAAEALQKILLSSGQEDDAVPDEAESWAAEDAKESSLTIWDEELTSLQSVFGDQFSRPSKDICRVTIKPSNRGRNAEIQPVLQFRRSSEYPQKLPVISVHAALPSYIRLSVMKQALNHAADNLLGEQMLFFLIDWVEQNLYSIVERPGKLRDIAAAASSTSEVRPIHRKRQKISRHPRPINWTPDPRSKEEWASRQTNLKLQSRIQQRKTLPAWEMREIIIDTVESHQVTIISGETGSGKSTQSAQFVLDDLYQRALGGTAKIICTQPRRISALGLADRVSDERCSTVGQEVGYIIRGESKVTPNTKITFVTTGVLLRRLQTSGGSSDDVVASLADISHVIIDEVHERSLDTDFLLVLLRDVLKQRKDLKLILMSATLDAGVFEDYFKSNGKVGRVEISGRTYPVEDYYLDDVIQMTGFNSGRGGRRDEEDAETSGMDADVAAAIQSIGMRINYDLIAQTVREIDADLTYQKQDGGILIFMPGLMEISRTIDALRSIPNLHALPLHASLQSSEQRRVFPHAPQGKRKVIVATNVAETSITIDDIVAVIDTGRVKETSYDPQNNMRKLEEVWASRAACKQRRGRAGRVQAGKCYKLYTRNAEMNKMAERPEPEIRRVPLEQLCLSVRAMGIKAVGKFLASALTPPESLAVDGAMDLLGRMGALDGDDLTALGRHLSMIPADLRCGKLMVYGAMFGCLNACVTIAAILTVKSPFVSPQDKRDEAKVARARFAKNQGDLIGDLKAYEQWDEMVNNRSIRQGEIRNWCSENFLSYQTLNDISSNRTQYLTSLRELSFIPSSPDAYQSLNKNNDSTTLLRSLCAGAFNPQLARIDFPDKKFAQSVSGAVELDPEAKTIKYFNQENGRVFVHPSSTVFDAQTFPGNSVYMSYFNKMATSKVFIRDLTPFNAYTALLFSGPITLDTLGRGLVVDGWLRLRGWARIGVLVSRLRGMLDDVLARKIDEPELNLAGNEVVDAVMRLVELDGLDQ
ncbi:P-loop containing nucleoside triphosphate hydrolase [Glarea lozoyensis ATCC 20868]|uniref:p-loop containing nucleoside triphosphate hydrolase n=1 Tax=Glarea lozoyensis (strain ATCC 20868 / MF5171) TaxID=1116229 RepID=S3DNC5_GLAL2|nr:P-loop containing nucleoside triphosphate hydrolase [Glarea lozoyensis ATCC 20868]EPE33596.1 P-loop containing nucleoside triphosphate hydrolase [Glarea lozoyensis ATCC 20868]